MQVQYKKVDYNPFQGPEIAKIAPATPEQLEIWTSILFGGHEASLAYNESVSLYLTGSLYTGAFEQALQEVINRHEALRTVFTPNGHQLCVYKTLQVDLSKIDITSDTPEQQEQAIANHVLDDVSTAFDLINGPMVRATLFQLSANQHCLVFTSHHIVCDGWSLGLIIKDYSQIYNSLLSDKMPQLPPAVTFSNYALAQAANELSAVQKQVEQFWVNQYQGEVPVLNLPADHPRPVIRTYNSQRLDYLLPENLVQGIKKASAKQGCSFVVAFTAAFEVFLYKLTGQKSIVLGIPAAGQSATGNYNLVGHCVNLLPLKSVIDGNVTFKDYLKQRTDYILDAFDHQNFTFGKLLQKINLKRDPSRVPLVPVVVNIDLGLDDGVNFMQLSHQLKYNPRICETFELFLNISDAPEGLQVEWSFNTSLFNPETISQWMTGLISLFKSMVDDQETALKDIQFHTGADVQPQVHTSFVASENYPAEPITSLIDKISEQYPTKTAVTYLDKQITYTELTSRSNRLANVLIKQGVQPGDNVGILLDRSIDLVVALLAVLKTGAAYVPLDVLFPKDRLAYMLSDAVTKLLLTSDKYSHHIDTDVPYLLVNNTEQQGIALNDQLPDMQISGDALAYIIYTSGSTGKPKGIEVEHHSLSNFLHSMLQQPGITEADRFLAVTTISFDIAGLEIYLPLLAGAELVMADAGTVKDGKALLKVIEEQEISIMQATPATWKLMLAAGWNHSINLKALCGGEALSKVLANQLLERCISVWNMYGPTETTIWSAVKKISRLDEYITVGKAIANTQIYILDESGNAVPDGEVGEIVIGGDGVARGYHHRPNLTAEKFTTIPALSNTPVYHTGDLGRFNEHGDLVCLGRSDHQIKIRGYRIESEEIETRLLELEDITAAVVVAKDDRLQAYVTTGLKIDNYQTVAAYWKTKLRTWLPEYMVPADMIVVPQIPLTPNGKVDRNALIAEHAAGHLANGDHIAPRSAMECTLADIWCRLLGLEKVSVVDDFFLLGGHSLLAAQMVAEVAKQTGQNVPLAALFTYPTIEKLAKHLQAEEVPVQGSLVAIKPTGNKMPLFIVHGYGLNVLMFNFLAEKMNPDQPVYALQAKGLNGKDTPAENISELAAYYISEIEQVSTTGPIALAGYSIGGVIALEMARQLQQRGRDVKMLAMIDSFAEVSLIDESKVIAAVKKVGRQMSKLWFVVCSLATNYKQARAYQFTILKNRLRHLLGKKVELEPVYSPLVEEILNKLDHALEHYKLMPFDGQITVFKARIRAYFVPEPKYLGWKPFARKGIKVYELPGDHKTMFDAKHHRTFAKLLQKALLNAAKK